MTKNSQKDNISIDLWLFCLLRPFVSLLSSGIVCSIFTASKLLLKLFVCSFIDNITFKMERPTGLPYLFSPLSLLFSPVIIDEKDDENRMKKIPEIYSSYMYSIYRCKSCVSFGLWEEVNTRSAFKIPSLSFVGEIQWLN